jgi:hypothetical protein
MTDRDSAEVLLEKLAGVIAEAGGCPVEVVYQMPLGLFIRLVSQYETYAKGGASDGKKVHGHGTHCLH